LAGLVFVAMSINLEEIVTDATHRNRAIGTMTGFTVVFILCGLVLMGNQNNLTVGIEWLAVSGPAAFVYVNGYIKAVKEGGTRSQLSIARTMFGSACYLAQIIGAILLMLGHAGGLYLSATGMMLMFASLISGTWILLVGICDKPGRTKHTR